MRLIDPVNFPISSLTPTDDLIEVYKTCLLIQDLCIRKKISGLSALQVGVPWVLSVCCFKPHEWRYFFNYSYTPISSKKKPTLTRFVNIEKEEARYFLVDRYEKVEYNTKELIVTNQPEVIEHTGTDSVIGLFIQNEFELSRGRFPDKDGEEYLLLRRS